MDPLATPKRIAFAGDWHMNTQWAVKAAAYAAASEADVIIHLGDFGYTYTEGYLDKLSAALQMPLLFVDGNHECFPRLFDYTVRHNGLRQLRSNIWHLPRGFRWQWSGVDFLALGGAHSIDRQSRREGISWWPEEAISYRLALEVADAGHADVMVTHDCPSDVPLLDRRLATTSHLWPEQEIVFSEGHRRLLRAVLDSVNPRFLWHGHYHWDYAEEVPCGDSVTTITGLNCDESQLSANVTIQNLKEIKERL